MFKLIMKKLAVIVILLFLAVTITYAVFNEGLEAAKVGDYGTCLKKWLPLAERGDSKAQFYLYLMYEKGKGMYQNYAEAVRWYRKAADQ